MPLNSISLEQSIGKVPVGWICGKTEGRERVIDAKEKSPIVITGNGDETEMLVEAKSFLIDGVYGDESCGCMLAGPGSLSHRSDKQVPPKTLALVFARDGQSSKENHSDVDGRQASGETRREGRSAYPAHREREVTGDLVEVRDQDEGAGKIAALVLKGVHSQPVVESLDTAQESGKILGIRETLKPQSTTLRGRALATWSTNAGGGADGASRAARNSRYFSADSMTVWWDSTSARASDSARSRRNSVTLQPARPAASARTSSSRADNRTSRRLSLSRMVTSSCPY